MAGEEFRISMDEIVELWSLILSPTEWIETSILTEIIWETSDSQFIYKIHNREDRRNLGRLKIRRAPEIMRQRYEEYYKPMELSIGPLYSDDPKLFKAELKLELAAKFIRDSGQSAETLLQRIRNGIEHLRTLFDTQVIESFNDDRLARLLLLDGCAMLQFIHSYVSQSLNEFWINNGQAALIQQDLFLLENQIPFDVLKMLISDNEMANLIPEFVLKNNIMAPVDSIRLLPARDVSWVLEQFKRKDNILHLLDFLRTILLIRHDDDTNSPNVSNVFLFCFHYICVPFLFVASKLGSLTAYILSFFHFSHRTDRWQPQQSFRNVQELKAAGITLKPSESCSLKAVSFHTRSFFRDQLKLPPLVVDDSTKCKLLNLVAYEMCNPNYQQQCEVTSYINLLDLLIDSEQDVKDLRAANILRNRLSSDVAVARMFNSMGSICFMPPSDTYLEIKSNIENHYKRKIAVWMAQAYHAHFSSPWTILALLAAVIVLSLTAIQAWLAIHPKK